MCEFVFEWVYVCVLTRLGNCKIRHAKNSSTQIYRSWITIGKYIMNPRHGEKPYCYVCHIFLLISWYFTFSNVRVNFLQWCILIITKNILSYQILYNLYRSTWLMITDALYLRYQIFPMIIFVPISWIQKKCKKELHYFLYHCSIYFMTIFLVHCFGFKIMQQKNGTNIIKKISRRCISPLILSFALAPDWFVTWHIGRK